VLWWLEKRAKGTLRFLEKAAYLSFSLFILHSASRLLTMIQKKKKTSLPPSLPPSLPSSLPSYLYKV